MTLGSTGALYGTTDNGNGSGCGGIGCGTVFKLTPPIVAGGKWTYEVIYAFRDVGYQVGSAGPLVLGEDEELYGTKGNTVFQLKPPAVAGGTWTYKSLYTFASAADGVEPFGPLAFDSNRRIVGVTAGGGTSNHGTVFQLTPPMSGSGGWTKDTLYNFKGGSEGAQPVMGLTAGGDGTFYGMTYVGGQLNSACTTYKGCGTVFELTLPSTTRIDFSQGFSGADGPIQLNGSTALDDSRLVLTGGAQNQAGSAFYATPINIQSFTTDFTFLLSDAVADGFTFTIQNVGPGELGGRGGSLGYEGIAKSVAIKFDLFNNLGEGADSTGLYIDGASPSIPAINLTHTGINLHSGDPMSVRITYNDGYGGGELILTITDQITNAAWSNSFAVDIPATVGGKTAYVGFTGATGWETSTEAITSWTYETGL